MDQKEAYEKIGTLILQCAQRELREELLWSSEALMHERKESETFFGPESWYHDIRFYLVWHSCPEHMDPSQRLALRLKSNLYYLADSVLYKKIMMEFD